jgi:hypothetical protein
MEATKMLKQDSRLTLAVVLIAATLLIAGGVAIASNTGFKINKSLVETNTAINANVGNNWTSLPYFHPYPNGQALCAAMGLRTSPSSTTQQAALQKIDPFTGVAVSAVCGPGAVTFTWSAGQGVRIRNTAKGTATSGPAAPTSAILVGSHNPSVPLSIPAPGSGNIGNLWFAVPYHTTAVTAQDLCNAVGMLSNPAASRGSVFRVNATTGLPDGPRFCGAPGGASTMTLTLGEAVRLRQPGGVASFVPAHF